MTTDRPSDEKILEVLARDGYAIVPDSLAPDVVAQLRQDLEAAIALETERSRARAQAKGVEYVDFGMLLVCCAYARSFVDVLAEPNVMQVIDRILSPGSIVYAFGSTSMPPFATNYSERIHVDCPRYIPGYATNAGAMMLLDDFTEANGATWVVPGSQHTREAPSAKEFFAAAKRIVAPAGSVVYLDPLVWHAGGKNETGRWRHAITVNMCRPYMKQRLDIPKMMAASKVDLTGVDERALQKMGYFVQVPESLDEYYLPREQRKFRQARE